jgi:hypothetical protein
MRDASTLHVHPMITNPTRTLYSSDPPTFMLHLSRHLRHLHDTIPHRRTPVRGASTLRVHPMITYTHPLLFRHHPPSSRVSHDVVPSRAGVGWFLCATPGACQRHAVVRLPAIWLNVLRSSRTGAQARGGCASTVRGPEAGTGGTTCVAWGGAVGDSRAPTVHPQERVCSRTVLARGACPCCGAPFAAKQTYPLLTDSFVHRGSRRCGCVVLRDYFPSWCSSCTALHSVLPRMASVVSR